MSSLTLLHTSDWHLGRSLYGRKRHSEAEAFLHWLTDVLRRESVDVLLVAGDVFDTPMPDTRAQRFYYEFLGRTLHTGCRHVVITAGNHDSAAFLAAPRGLLECLRVHVVSEADPETEVLTLCAEDGSPQCIVGAVPFLRDRDLQPPEAGENLAERDRKLLDGLHAHYACVATLAEARRQAFAVPVPLVLMGHLFAAGGVAESGDGVRELYLGSLARVGSELFPPHADYVALGHLHSAQLVNGQDRIRYSGSPLPMRCSETAAKSVFLIRFDVENSEIQREIVRLSVPVWQRLESVRGDWDAIARRISTLRDEKVSVWLEVEYTGAAVMPDLRSRLEELTHDAAVDILRVQDSRLSEGARSASAPQLEDLNEDDVFLRLLDARAVPEEQREDLRRLYREIVRQSHDAVVGTELTKFPAP